MIDNHDVSYDPRTRANLRMSWVPNDDTNVTMTVFRTGSIMNYDYNAKIDEHYTANLYTSYNVSPDLVLGLTVTNLFNAKPPKDATWLGWPYFYRGQYSARGRAINVAAKYTF